MADAAKHHLRRQGVLALLPTSHDELVVERRLYTVTKVESADTSRFLAPGEEPEGAVDVDIEVEELFVQLVLASGVDGAVVGDDVVK